MKIRVRLARPEDKEPLMSFVTKTWSWGDYVPEMWDRWLQDPEGRIFVAVCDGSPVGMNHVRFLREGLAWLEGVRVRPDMRGKGVATSLARYALDFSRRRGMKWAGLLSSEDNLTAHKQIERMKMKKVCTFNYYEMKKGAVGRSGLGRPMVKVADTSRFRIVSGTILGSPEYKATKGNFTEDWAVRSFSRYGLKRLIEEKRILISEDCGGRRAVMVVCQGGRVFEGSLEISFSCGDRSLLERMVRGVFASFEKDIRVYSMVPEIMSSVNTFEELGFQKENRFIFFRRRIPTQRDF